MAGQAKGPEVRTATSGAGLRFRVEVEPGHEAEGKPRVEARLQRQAYPEGSNEAFAPRRLPDLLSLRLLGLDAGALRRGSVALDAKLSPGKHELPLAGGEPFQVVIDRETRLSGSLSMDRPRRGEPGPTLLQSAELTFDPPLALPNVLQTLMEVQHLFEDRQLSALVQRARQSPSLQALRSAGSVALDAGGRIAGRLRARLQRSLEQHLSPELKERVDEVGAWVQETWAKAPTEAGVILLRHVSARPRWERNERRWELELRFSGELRWLDRLPQPFTEVLLPAAILPIPHAELRLLASEAPLASGRFRGERFAQEGFADSLLGALHEARCDLELEVELPELDLHSVAVDRTHLDAGLRLPPRCSLVGELELRRPDTATGNHWRGLSFRSTRLSLGFPQHAEHGLGLALRGELGLHLDGSPLPLRERSRATLSVGLAPGSSLPDLQLSVRGEHPLALGGAGLTLGLPELRAEGELALDWDGQGLAVEPAGLGLRFESSLALHEQVLMSRARSEVWGQVREGRVRLSVEPAETGDRRWTVRLAAAAELEQRIEAQVAPIPELGLSDERLVARLVSRLALDGAAVVRFRGPQMPEVELTAGAKAELLLRRAEAELDGRRIELPAGTELRGLLHEGVFAAQGLGDVCVDVAWDLKGKPCLLHGRGRSASLLTEALRQGELRMHLTPSGRVSFSGLRGGLYGVRFFNALLNPAAEPAQLMDLLRSDDALQHVVSGLELLDPGAAELLQDLRSLLLGAREILRREGLVQAGDILPRATLARTLSLLLVGTDELAAAFVPLVRSVTEGNGLDIEATKELLRGPLAGFHLDYEVDGILRWLDLVTRPSEPPLRDPPRVAASLAEDARFASARVDLPSAAEIRAALLQPTPGMPQRVAELAPRLTRSQLDHILRTAQGWPADALRRIGYVRDVKRRVARIEEGYGGMEYAAQVSTLTAFLGEAVGPLPTLDPGPSQGWPPPCALGPHEVAVLLQAGLAAGHQGLQTQINNRMLVDLLLSRPSDFLIEVLVEMGQRTARALTGVLFSFLHQDQDQLRHPLDLAAALSEKLGLPVPVQADYLAGGRKARKSYFGALSELAERIFERVGPIFAARCHLQEERHPVPPDATVEGAQAEAETEARRRIAEADALAADLAREAAPEPAREAARGAYRQAFAACARFLELCPTGFSCSWLRDFWRRNEEALRVLSVLRNHQADVDQDRRWLAIGGRGPEAHDEQSLLERIVRTLYASEADQDLLLADPLVWLLIDPDPSLRYDFSIVTGMGVVTDGVDGHELEHAFARLEQTRGVRVLRAHTGLFRSLEYNADRIIEAIQRTEGPWGFIGYSQGCANALLAEALLRGGTPDRQALLDRLVCRNLLFSAANGSVHGSSGSVKFRRAMIEGEKILKHYQAHTSRELVDIAFRGLKAALDSAAFLKTVGGTESLTIDRARYLHRDGQFVPWATTSTTRGVVHPGCLPEALEYLYAVHGHLAPGVPCDSQVAVDDAVGHATRIRSPHTEVLRRCDMGSLAQATHHWAPLTVEIEMVKTRKDEALAVYDGPKDRMVTPWVEVNARFGRIPARPC